jgi:hypothetical protein
MWVMAKNPASTELSKNRGIEDDILLHGRMTLRMVLLVRVVVIFPDGSH